MKPSVAQSGRFIDTRGRQWLGQRPPLQVDVRRDFSEACNIDPLGTLFSS